MKKKVLFIILPVILILLIGVVVFLNLNSFQVKNFKDTLEIPYNTTFHADTGNVCFGNKFKCHEVKVTKTGEVDTSKIGTYEITKSPITIKVNDTTPPVCTITFSEILLPLIFMSFFLKVL